MVNTGTLFAGRYELRRKIGSGGMADVFEAQDTERDILVALKILKTDLSGDEAFVRRFEKEGDAASSLNNGNIVSVYEVGSYNGYYYISMELVDGITLKEYIRRKGALTPRETMAISAQIAVGLRAAHAKHIIHRDVKPQNVILSREGKVKVTDFGIASLNTDETKTMNNNTMGSVQYISPEQAKGSACDERSDIYSLGICMYEMITGQVPFDKTTSVAVALAHMNETMTPPSKLNPGCPRALEQIIFRCTQKSRERRYHNCTELLQDLRIAVSSPDFNFEKQEQDNLMKSNTQVFSEEETEQIRTLSASGAAASKAASNPVRTTARAASAEAPARRNISTSVSGNRSFREAEEAAPARQKQLFEEDMREDDKTIFDRIIAVMGVFLGAAMVCMIIYISGTLSGWFQGSTVKPTSASKTKNESKTTEDTSDVTVDTGDTLETFDPNYIDEETQTIVPKVVGMGISGAIQVLQDKGLGYRISSNVIYSDVYKIGTVCMQSYEEGTVVLKNSTIVLTLSAGTDKFEIKDSYVGGSIVVFRNEVSRFGDAIEVEYVKINSDTIPANTIISISPSTGIVSAGQKIVVTFSGGPAYIPCPDLLGMGRAEAISTLSAKGLSVGSVTFEYDLEYEKGKVMKQEFEPNTLVANGGTVDIVVSNGPKISQVPDLLTYYDEEKDPDHKNGTPMTVEQAQEILEELNYKVKIVEVIDEKNDDGIVIEQSPEADSDLAEGETVTITVARKDIIRKVPNVVTKTVKVEDPDDPDSTETKETTVTKEEALDILRAQGFTNVTVKTTRTRNAEENNIVYKQDPTAGTELSVKKTVTIYVYLSDEQSTSESDSTESTESTASTESTESTASTESTESTASTDPTESTESSNPAESSSEQTEPSGPSQRQNNP